MENQSDRDKALAKAAGLNRWFRAQLLNGLNRLFLVLLIPGGLIIAFATPDDRPQTIIVCVSVCGAIAVVMSLRIALILRQLRRNPEKAVARLTKWRTLKRAGFTSVS